MEKYSTAGRLVTDPSRKAEALVREVSERRCSGKQGEEDRGARTLGVGHIARKIQAR